MEAGSKPRPPATRGKSHRIGYTDGGMVAGRSEFPLSDVLPPMGDTAVELPSALSALGADLRANGWELALEVVDEGLRDDVIPSLARLGKVAQLGDMPTFIAELGREVQT